MKEQRYLNCKKRGYIAYNYLKKEKITIILEGVNNDNKSQKKE